ncbi:MAG: Mor transcription activator family protein [Rhodoferax sp.]
MPDTNRHPSNINTLIAQAKATALAFSVTCADDLAQALIARLIKHAGGQKIYIPTLAHSKALLRNSKIRTQFTGSNTAELARMHRISPKQIRNILGHTRSVGAP